MLRTSLLGLALAACGDNAGPCNGKAAAPPPAPCASGACTDVHVVAHEDDDLLFMNPDIASELAGHHRVVIVYVTAGELADVAHEAYWRGREAGVLAAYAFLVHGGPVALRDAIDPMWTASTDELAGLTFTTYRAGSLALVFLHLGDFQTQCLWENTNGCSVVDAHPVAPPYLAVTKACPDCTPPLAAQQVSRDQLIDVLAQLMTREGATRVATLDSTATYFDALGGAGDGYHEYSDHYFTALFATTAAARALVPELAAYRGYTIARAGANLDHGQACGKFDAFAHYAIYDPDVVKPDQRNRFSSCPSCYFHDAYGVTSTDSWERRQLGAKSVVLPARFALHAGAACVTSTLALGDCADAAVFTGAKVSIATAGGCLDVAAPAGHVDTPAPYCGGVPCLPVPSLYPPDAVTLAACDTEGSAVHVLSNGQIRTANARCLTVRGAALVSDDCRPRIAGGHVTDQPEEDQQWLLESR